MRVLALLAVAATLALSPPASPPGPRYAEDGRLVLPEDYREWVFLSSGLGMSYGPVAMGESQPMFDNVFVTPEAYRGFRETGHWPDRTVLVLEVRSSSSHGSINKDGHFQTGLVGLESLVRDERRFPEKWAFFGFETEDGRPARLGSPFGPRSRCLACHTANGAVDGTFVQFYPTLLEIAEKKGTLRPGFHPVDHKPTDGV
jgi:Cytochrome P460